MTFSENRPITYKLLLARAERLFVSFTRTGGRTALGNITAFKTSGVKFRRMLRFIDFWRRIQSPAFIIKLEFDSFRSSTISLVLYRDGFMSYVVLPSSCKVGDKLLFYEKNFMSFDVNAYGSGVALPLGSLSSGLTVFNVELWPSKGAQLCRAAGTSAVIINSKLGFTTLKLRSGWKVLLSDCNFATLGVAPNFGHMYQATYKAGTARNLGRTPTVRGVAMNAIDHPHGGGRGKTSGGPKPRTPWGKITKQQPTVSRRKRLRFISIRHR